ncbi:MAG: signal peptidase I [Bacteroidetes bacterium]|nr:signal peptidase I [Bacteroidota bacterium]
MRRTVRDGVVLLFFTLLFATGLKSCVIDAFKIPTASMEPALAVGDYLLVNKFIFGGHTPEKFLFVSIPSFQFPAFRSVRRGDVILFVFPGEPNEVLSVRNLFLVKRCIGLPGDTVDVTNGNVRVNGFRMDFFDHAANDAASVIVPKKGMTIPLDTVTIGRWKVFIMREGSSVDIQNGAILIDQQEAKSYTVKRDYYFALGDNINDSADSRAWGFIPEKNIVGKAMLVYFSKNDRGVQWGRIGTVIR